MAKRGCPCVNASPKPDLSVMPEKSSILVRTLLSQKCKINIDSHVCEHCEQCDTIHSLGLLFFKNT